MNTSALHAQLTHTLRQTDLPSLGTPYKGKVRDTYRKGDTLILVTSDRLSAFDHVLTTIPFKGEVLNRLAAFWFDRTKHIVPNHVLDVPDANVTVARACQPFSVEVVVRGYLTGSLWRDYEKGTHTAYGVPFAEGLRKDSAFEAPILTPSTKAEYGKHDEPISEAEILARGLATPRDWARITEAARGLFLEGQKWARTRGLILVDTKYEFGKVGDELYVIDEMHTPDSSRYWVADEYESRFAKGEDQKMLDKENIRQWLIRERNFSGHGALPAIPDDVRVDLATKYVAAYERITGTPLVLTPGDVHSRIEGHLRAKGYL
ncbi:phosphoribosylaminoimidazole-succinocarboxamide synthase [Corallococcus coralloides DSM 2259]|uniref:Phosphoribosylaminoimidazole-succinocarboxamide synthase n=1 Tax=Corallococcus coralloides (strain ATCC 25202 / DSM 2259 / NBRC 100086 / M2) TaxID=1144275 RepID=H8MJS7_CORCM|nr:phosphoribosylaminoimidazolesuccinocarboxamide synthase [Corallococcus coralloides]AFE10039.1 phosphoribosylaminoimidazole-succinocarboxamide synthase [Corallococcus coralloides DSM 2259]